MEVGQPQAACPLHQARKGAVPRRWERAAGRERRQVWGGRVHALIPAQEAEAQHRWTTRRPKVYF